MAAVNKVILLGNLGADPEVRGLASGEPVASLRLATTETRKDKATGERREQTEWHRVVLFGRLAKVAVDWLRKGSPVYLEGRLRTRRWTGQDGRERSGTEIVADTLRLLGRREERPDDRQPYRPHAGVDDLDVPYEITDSVGVWGGEEPPF